MYPGFNSLVGLADDGLDLKPTLLCVLTDLYVQKASHTSEEERQFVELALRLIDVVDAATRAEAARRLSIYPGAPAEIVRRLTDNLFPSVAEQQQSFAPLAEAYSASSEGAEIAEQFFAALPEERAALLAELDGRGPPDPPVHLTGDAMNLSPRIGGKGVVLIGIELIHDRQIGHPAQARDRRQRILEARQRPGRVYANGRRDQDQALGQR